MKIAPARLAGAALMLAVGISHRALGQTDDFGIAVKALSPDHYCRLNEPALGPPKEDDNGDPLAVDPAGVNARGTQYEGEVLDEGSRQR